MAIKTKSSTHPIPLSYFISLKIGKMKLGSVSLKPKGNKAKDPEIMQSLVIEKLSNNWTKSDPNTNKSNKKSGGVIKNNPLTTVKDPNDPMKGLLFSKATFTLTMANNLNLEKKLLKYLKKTINKASDKAGIATFRYGYVNGMKSFTYKGYITGMSMSSDFYTLTLSLSPSNGTTDKYSKWKKKTKKALRKRFKKKSKKKYRRYSDLVKDIARKQGWKIGTITKTKKVRASSIIAPTTKQSPVQYINSFKKKAISTKGEGKYKSRFRFNSNGKVVYEFVPSTFKSSAGYRAKKNYNFVMGMLPDGVVISFKPVLVDGLGVAGYFRALNAKKKTKKKRKKNFKNVFGTITKNSKETTSVSYTVKNSKKNSKGLVNADDNILALNASAMRVNASSADVANYAEAVIKNDFGKYAYSVALNSGATMEILGDPQLQQGDLINVLPMYPVQSGASGSIMHPSGGTYRIVGIQDNIGSTYTTSLNLVKEANSKKLTKVSGKKKKRKKKSSKKSKKPSSYKVGDVVNFKGGKYYLSSYKGSKGYTAKAGKAKITKINKRLLNVKGAHPYHLIHTTNASTVYGWVNKDRF